MTHRGSDREHRDDVDVLLERALPRLADALVERLAPKVLVALQAARREDLQTILRDELFTAAVEGVLEKALLRADARRATIDAASEVRRADAEGEDVWRDPRTAKSEFSDPIVMDVDGVSRSSMLKASELVSRARAKKKPGK